MMEDVAALLIVLVVLAVFFGGTGAICAFIAKAKGRSVWGWFWGGAAIALVNPLIGIIIVAVLPNLEEKRRRERRIERENRRLREQIRQERIKSDSFRQHATSRLDVHDESLGIDTRQTHQALADLSAASEGQRQLTADDGIDGDKMRAAQWYFDHGGEVSGPHDRSHLDTLYRSGQITDSTLVWSEHLTDWTPLSKVDVFGQAPPSNAPSRYRR